MTDQPQIGRVEVKPDQDEEARRLGQVEPLRDHVAAAFERLRRHQEEAEQDG